MRWIFILALLQTSATLRAQTILPPEQPSSIIRNTTESPDLLPDSPGAIQVSQPAASTLPPPCKPESQNADAIVGDNDQPPCPPPPDRNPYRRFLNSAAPLQLTPRQKGFLAIHNVIDPANILTIVANAGFTVGIDSHTGYGPGLKGFGRDIGYSFVQDATGEFFSTFLFDSLFRQDPHYHRMPTGKVPRRFLHAISHTFVSMHDDGTPMPNYSDLLTYPISAEIANLYVPGVAVNAPSTAKRVAIGIATSPIDDIVTEFLPDFARHVHIRVVFLQQILNNVSTGQPI